MSVQEASDETQKPFYNTRRTTYNLNSLASLTHQLQAPIASNPQFGQENKRKEMMSSLRIGSSFSLISSVAEFNDTGMQGFLAGMRLELPINDKLSLIGGLQFGEKHFDRMKLNMTPANASLNRAADFWISRLQANIQLLEIPLMLRYRFSNDRKVNLYFQGGFSPVVTLNEQYHHYDPKAASNVLETASRTDIDFTSARNNPALEDYINGLEPQVMVHTLNTYVGFLQVAPGLEVQVAPKLALQLEPYIQLGLQRVGSERQTIHSLGGTISLMYDLRSVK